MSFPARIVEVKGHSSPPAKLAELSPGLQELVRQGRLTPARAFTARLPLPPALPPDATLTASEALNELRSED